MKAVALQVSLASLHRILGLPKNVRLTRVRQTWEDENACQFEILAESEQFEPVLEGLPIPRGVIEVHQVDNFLQSDIIIR